MQTESETATSEERGFGYCEHLLLWAWRRMAVGRARCPVLAREFSGACGEQAPEVFLTFCTFLQALAFASRRPLTIGAPGCIAITADERQVLTLIAAAQRETPALFEAHLRWLTRPQRRHTLHIAVSALATALKVNRLCLVLPECESPRVCARPSAVA